MSNSSSTSIIVDIPKKSKLHISPTEWILCYLLPSLITFCFFAIMLPLVTAFIVSFVVNIVIFYLFKLNEESGYTLF